MRKNLFVKNSYKASEIEEISKKNIGFISKNLEDEEKLKFAKKYMVVANCYKNSTQILDFLLIFIKDKDELLYVENLAKKQNKIARVLLNFTDEYELRKNFLYARNSKFLNVVGLDLENKKFDNIECIKSFKALCGIRFLISKTSTNLTYIQRID